MNFISSRKIDTGLLLSPLNKIWMPLVSTWVRGDIEGSPHIIYPFNYDKDIFYPLPWIGRHMQWIQGHILPSFHETISSGLLGNKIIKVSERKFIIRGLKNKFLLELGTWSTLWMYVMKGLKPPPICYYFWEGTNLS